METLNETGESNKTFFSHIFSNTQEDKGELLNVVQYAVMGLTPVVLLNKSIQRFVPEADPDKSSIELLVEILVQFIIIFIGIILIHRAITFFPTYSGFKYESVALSNVILSFMVIVLSIQSKVGTKTNILVDRLNDLWNGYSSEDVQTMKKKSRNNSNHSPSQADNLDDNGTQSGMFPPAPITSKRNEERNPNYDDNEGFMTEPMPASSLLGSSFS